MRNLILSFLLLISVQVFAQETVTRTNRVNNAFSEKFEVLKSHKKIRQGFYKALLNDTVVIAEGHYTNGVRTGLWNFYNPKGKLVQTFDYAHNLLNITDTTDDKPISFYIDKLSPQDVVIPAYKIGGAFFGYYNYIRPNRNLGIMLRLSIGVGEFKVTHVLTVSAIGQLMDHEVYTNTDGQEKRYDLGKSGLTDEDMTFIPAKVNGKRRVCKLYFVSIIKIGATVNAVSTY
jgi:antitoxin component YwqK of YwqJK toxin-antitoxin module